MALICHDCGTEYGDPELDGIPIICSNCVESPEDFDDDDDEDSGGDDE